MKKEMKFLPGRSRLESRYPANIVMSMLQDVPMNATRNVIPYAFSIRLLDMNRYL